MHYDQLRVKILLPFRVFADMPEVRRLVAESREGAIGLLPNRLDCVLALAPGILTYETAAQEEAYIALDEGILVKTGDQVLISVRNAIAGAGLEDLQRAVAQQFLESREDEKDLRTALAKLEMDFIRRFSYLRKQ